MNSTVYFATNRMVTNTSDALDGYPATMVPPSDPTAITYGVASITGVDVTSGAQGVVGGIGATQKGGFPQAAAAALSHPGGDLLVFVHGFDNTFSDAVTRAAFNAAWLGSPGIPPTIATFAWPSKGQVIGFPVATEDYQADQHMARASGAHLMSFLANIDPLIRQARARNPRMRATLLTHSMGNLALQSAVETWFLDGNGTDMIFDQAILAAADCAYDSFAQPNLAQLSGLALLAKRVSVYYSHADQVLQLSKVVNLGAQRLGQDGPAGRADPAKFPPSAYAMIDCSDYRDYDFGFLNSHQYYRQSPSVRAIIAASR